MYYIQYCAACHAFFAPSVPTAPPITHCPAGHTLSTHNFTITTSLGTATSTTGYISLSGPEPERTPVPAAFYDAFEDDEEQEPRTISFACANCEEPLTLTARSPRSTISGTFCPKCDEQYYVCWEDGTLKRGRMVE
jgi:hypothetical protein